MAVCWKNLHHSQKFPNQAHDKGVKPRTYVSDDKIWLNNRYIKSK